MELDERKQRILRAIIQDYISSAEPVGSRTIARKYDLGVSAATIRNEMFDLEIMGYLQQPHTSAGRVPSSKGYRFYVDCLLEPRQVTDKERQVVQTWFEDKMNDVDQIFRSTAKILAKITHNVTLVMASREVSSRLKYIRFLPLDGRRAIMIVVTDTGQIENCLYPKGDDVSIDELNAIAEKLTRYLAGTPMAQINMTLLERFHQPIVDDMELYRQAFRSIQRSFRREHQVYRGGAMELLDKPEFRDVGKAKSLFDMLEEQDIVANLLYDEQCMSEHPVTVRIGDEAKLTPFTDCSIIEATFTANNVVLGKIAVLGPTRMEYAKIIGLLDFMKEHVTHILEHYRDAE